MVAKKNLEEKITISSLTSTYSYMILLLLAGSLLGWTASIYKKCKNDVTNEKIYEEFAELAGISITLSNTSDLALALFILLSLLAAIGLGGLLSLFATPTLINNGRIYTLLGSILGAVILISIGLIVVGSMAAYSWAELDNNKKLLGIDSAGLYIDLTLISFVGGLIPLLSILVVFIAHRYYM